MKKKNDPYSVLYLQGFHEKYLSKPNQGIHIVSSYPFSTLACTAETMPSRIPSGSFTDVEELSFALLK